MLKTTLSFTARVGGLVLLMCLCRSQAHPLMDAARAGNLPVTGLAILSGLVFTHAACMLALIRHLAAALCRLCPSAGA